MENAKDTYLIKNINFFRVGKGTKLYPNEGGITKNKEK